MHPSQPGALVLWEENGGVCQVTDVMNGDVGFDGQKVRDINIVHPEEVNVLEDACRSLGTCAVGSSQRKPWQ